MDNLGYYLLAFLILIVAGVILILNITEIKNKSKSKWDTMIFTLVFPIIATLIMLGFPVYFIMILCRIIVSIILWIKHRDKFFGLVSGIDTFSASQTLNQSVINSVIICEIDTANNAKSIFEYTQEKIEQKIIKKEGQLTRLFTTLKEYAGFIYFEKANIKDHVYLRTLPTVSDELDQATLQKLLGQWYFEPFQGPLLWDVAVGTQPMKWRTSPNPNIKFYPIVFRAHHVIADGITLVKLLVGLLGDKSETEEISKFEKYAKKEELGLFNYAKQLFRLIIYFPAALFSLLALKSRDVNELHGKIKNEIETIAFALDENGAYLNKVKEIKRYTGATVPEIIITAFAESLKKHFIKYQQHCPNDITLVIAAVQNYLELLNIQPGKLDVKDITLNNRFVMIALKIPTFIENEEGFDSTMPILSRLTVVRRLANALKASVEPRVSYCIFHIFGGVLPISWVRYICDSTHSTLAISLIPGPQKTTFCNGAIAVSDVMFCLPHLLNLDIMLTSLSYDNKLTLSLNCDAVYIPELDVANEILINTFKYIDELKNELEPLFHKK